MIYRAFPAPTPLPDGGSFGMGEAILPVRWSRGGISMGGIGRRRIQARRSDTCSAPDIPSANFDVR
jgi:hypothetical protein